MFNAYYDISEKFLRFKQAIKYEFVSRGKKRLKFIGWHDLDSLDFSENKKKSVSLTCRRFGLFRSYFCR